jgi:DNA-binding transcriptional regulator GbsR (MarR family)
MSDYSRNNNGFEGASQAFSEGLTRIARLYGVSPLAGRLYAVLFLAAGALSLEELCARTQAAKSSVSVALRSLAHARVARRLPSRGDRRDYYEAITDPWQVLSDWNRLFFEEEITMFLESGAALERALDGASDAPTGKAADELRRRIEAMRDFCDLFRDMFGQFERTRPNTREPRAIAIPIEREDEK